MKIINVRVDGNIKIVDIFDTCTQTSETVGRSLKIPTGNYKDILLKFDFVCPKIEEGLHLFAMFNAEKLENPIEVEIMNIEAEGEIYQTSCFIPGEVLEEIGVFELGIYGYIAEDDNLKKRISLEPIKNKVIKGSYDENAVVEVTPTPTVFEVYFDEVTKANAQMQANLEQYENDINNLFDNANKNLKKIKHFNSVEEMKASTDLIETYIVMTLGYYEAHDGGGAIYQVVNDETLIDNAGTIIDLADGLKAKMLIKNNIINVKQIGLKNNGVTDNEPILCNFLQAANLDSVSLFFPRGTYLFNKSLERSIVLPNKTKLIGENGTIIFFNDTAEAKGEPLFAGNQEILEIEGIKFKSTFDTIENGNNASQLYYGSAQNIYINKCKFEYFRAVNMVSNNSENVFVTNSKFYMNGRDCNRFTNAKFVYVSHNIFEYCGDDIVAAHGDVEDSTIIFCNNYVFASYGVGALGVKHIDIYDNTFILPLLIVKSGFDGTEGGTTKDVNFHNNTIVQPCHLVSGGGRTLTFFHPQTENVYFNDNDIKDGDYTHSDIILTGVKNLNAELNKGMFVLYTTGEVKYLQMKDNKISAPVGTSEAGFGDTRLMYGKFKDVDMYNNRIENFYASLQHGSNVLSWNVCDNYFNGDTQHILTTDGMFANSNVLRIFSSYPLNFKRNTLRNVSGNYDITKLNYVLYQPDGKYMNPTTNQTPCKFIPYNEETGAVLNDVKEVSGSMPTSGYYHLGDFVRRIYTSPDQPIGWFRLTTGNSHVLDTDWKAVYAKVDNT